MSLGHTSGSQVTNKIYYFYEKLEQNPSRDTKAGDRYYRCYHGSWQVFTITKAMKFSLNGLTGHLSSKFPSMYKFYKYLQDRGTELSEKELKIARGEKELNPEAMTKFLGKLDAEVNTILKAFKHQTLKNEDDFDYSVFKDLLCNYLIAQDHPFDTVECSHLTALLNYVHHRATPLKIPSRHEVRAWVMKMGDDLTEREVVGEHSGENIAASVWQTLELYGLKGKISAFAMDNATNNDTLVQAIQDRCDAEGIDFDANRARLRCLPHTVHLAALELLNGLGAYPHVARWKLAQKAAYQDSVTTPVGREHDDDAEAYEENDSDNDLPSLETVSDSNEEGIGLAVVKLHRIIKTVRSSPQKRHAWKNEIRLINTSRTAAGEKALPELMLILDVKTRWSSTHQMLRRALDFIDVIESFVAKTKDLRPFELSSLDWEAIRLVTGWLKSFRSTTTQMSATKTATISFTHAIFRSLQADVCDALKSLPPHHATLRSTLLKAHRKLSDYYYRFDSSPLYLWASLLDPRIMYSGLMQDVTHDEDLKKEVKNAKESLKFYYNMHYATRMKSTAPPTPATPKRTSISTLDSSPQKVDFTSRYESDIVEVNELEDYFKLPRDSFAKCDPIQWWTARKARYPTLSKCALTLLAIPGSAVAVERVFSGGRDTVGIRRSSLKPETIRTLMLLKHHLRLTQANAREFLLNTAAM
ncbi:transposase-like protein [Moniliophthora roreri]|nr:transposase-like protein [Moniliophthora roreri]